MLCNRIIIKTIFRVCVCVCVLRSSVGFDIRRSRHTRERREHHQFNLRREVQPGATGVHLLVPLRRGVYGNLIHNVVMILIRYKLKLTRTCTG